MANEQMPAAGDWYRRLDTGVELEVLAVDAAQRTLEVADRDGEAAVIDLDSWFELELEPTAAPNDDSHALDEIEPDDLGYGGPDQPGAGGAVPEEGIEPRRYDEDGEEESE